MSWPPPIRYRAPLTELRPYQHPSRARQALLVALTLAALGGLLWCTGAGP